MKVNTSVMSQISKTLKYQKQLRIHMEAYVQISLDSANETELLEQLKAMPEVKASQQKVKGFEVYKVRQTLYRTN